MNEMLANANLAGLQPTDLSTKNVVTASALYILTLLVLCVPSTWGCAIYGKVPKLLSNLIMWLWMVAVSALWVLSFAFYMGCFRGRAWVFPYMLGFLAAGALTLIYRRKHGIKDADQVWVEEQRTAAKAPLSARVRAAKKQMLVALACAVPTVIAVPTGAAWSAWHSGITVQVALEIGLSTFQRPYELLWIALAVIGSWAAVAIYLSLRGQQRRHDRANFLQR